MEIIKRFFIYSDFPNIIENSRERNKVITIIDTSKTEIIKKRKEMGRWVKVK